MRNRIFLTLVLSLCMADFGAFAAPATRGNARGTVAANNAAVTTQSVPVAARAASRQKVANNVQTSNATSGNVAARAGKKQTVVSNNASAPKPMAARAGATQKVINNGTKVASATSNTVIDQECQDAFYGCMDSFCMIDNASGGRCQCSNRNTELTSVMDDIAKLDEQSYLMATEGVERIQMGESADQIIARAKAAADKVTVEEKKQENQKKVRTLDLSAWNNNIFSEDEDIFDNVDISVDASAVSNALSKTGDALYTDAAKMCIAQMPAKCNASVKMLQNVYAQKIKSDCMAFENSLKQQKIASTQKLQAAEKALRDASLEKFQEENKYGLGQCQARYSQCMQEECGSDYTKCVTLAAAENVRTSGQSKSTKTKQRTIKGAVSSITLAASTIDQITAKKNICDDEVLKYCVNVKNQVWDAFLADAAAALKSAELIAEDNLRQNCVKDVASCFQSACQGQFDPERESGKYDMCLSEPKLLVDLCKVKIEPCLEATGGSLTKLTDSRLWSGVTAMLGAMRVDECTKEVKECITDICGADYTGCIGLDTNTIGNMCSERKLTACMTSHDKNTVRDYVAEVAQGIALQIDNAMVTACQKAADAAMVKVCGATDSCDGADFDLSTISSLMKVEACRYDNEKGSQKTCRPDISSFAENEIYINEYEIIWADTAKTKIKSVTQKRRADANGYGVFAELNGKPDISLISFDASNTNDTSDTNTNSGSIPLTNITFSIGDNTVATGYSTTNTNSVINILDAAYQRVISSIESDPTVQYCITGRKVQGFKGITTDDDGKTTGGDIESAAARFPTLTNSIRHTVASSLLSKLSSKNMDLEKTFEDKIVALNNKISERMAEIAERQGAEVESLIDAYNAEQCMCNANASDNSSKGCYSAKDKHGMHETEGGYNGRQIRLAKAYIRQLTDLDGTYDAGTNVCTLKKIQYTCTNYVSPSCKTFDEGKVLETSSVQMTKFK